ncbi:slit homolog 3 protein [Thalassophryne amazonica]|uniref:slit homolog 3 protein n=1 Tax=Thalassophryne amazonica TaxID=390379 RepID=UPI001470CA10|nr:slit homolog 3 protein [Thalassophryne amazonica]
MYSYSPISFFFFIFYTSTAFFLIVKGLRLCPQRCICYEHADLVDCRARGFRHVPRGLPPSTWLLELGGNRLGEIRTRAFTGVWSLRVLLLANSQIQQIQPQGFFFLSFLEKLDLSCNHLTSLPVDFSASLSALRELHLGHNDIHQISKYSFENLDSIEKRTSATTSGVYSPGVFRGLSRLRQLYLQNNRLTTVQQGSLDMLPGLEVLQLNNNNISEIEIDALAPLYSLGVLALEGNSLHHLNFKTFISLHTAATHIQLSGNPWSCDCDLHCVFSKILHVRHLHVDDYHNVTCAEPPLLAGALLASVDSQLCIAETATVLIITGTVLITVMAAVVMAERNRKRSHGKKWDSTSQTCTHS